VVWLQELAPAKPSGGRFGRYVQEFLPQIGVRDELGLFCPAVGSDSVAVFLNRRDGRFSASEAARLRAFYPAVAVLYRQHIKALLRSDAAAVSPSLGRPLRVTSAAGRTIWVTQEWQAQAAPERAAPEQTGQCTAIAADFGVAERFVWTPAPEGGAAAADSVAWAARAGLTPRECDIVRLMLRGLDSRAIAAALGLSEGNVKNHKRRIYGKLDITSERELILMYLAAVTAEA
jgi:DNA-binding CsgD family transcriptional regulator